MATHCLHTSTLFDGQSRTCSELMFRETVNESKAKLKERERADGFSLADPSSTVFYRQKGSTERFGAQVLYYFKVESSSTP